MCHSKLIRSEAGQGLIEYLIIVALMGVATIAIVRVMGEQVSSNFASVTYALQGSEKKANKARINKSDFKRKDLGDFMKGTADRAGGSDGHGE